MMECPVNALTLIRRLVLCLAFLEACAHPGAGQPSAPPAVTTAPAVPPAPAPPPGPEAQANGEAAFQVLVRDELHRISKSYA